MTTLLFLDDERDFKDVTWLSYPEYQEVIVVRNYKDFVKTIDNLSNDTLNTLHISLDHDLQDFTEGVERTGRDCCNYLQNYLFSNNVQPNKITLVAHSQNPVGRSSIENSWKSFVTTFLVAQCKHNITTYTEVWYV